MTTPSPFIVTVRHEIPAKEIAYQFIAAVEGGSGYWCSQIIPKVHRLTKESPWYADPEVWADPTFVILVTETEGDDGEPKVHEITHEDIGKGLQVMAEKYASTFQEILDDNADANTADIFLQCVVFGKEVYA